MIRSSLVALFLAVGLVPAASAGEAADLARKAEELAADGQHIDALNTIRAALDEIWNKTPLGVRKAIFVSREPGGYGVYEPRLDNIFQEGEKLIVYSEPVGFGWEERGGAYFSDIVVDFAIRNSEGDVLAEQKAFGRFTYTSRERNSEYMARVNLDITGAPAGSYVLNLTFNDQIGKETAEIDLPFEIR